MIKEIEESSKIYDSNLYEYIKNNKINERNILFISGKSHYYYSIEELHNISTIVLIKKLNEIKELDNIVSDIYNVCKKNTVICGRFINSKYVLPDYLKLFEMIDEFINQKINRKLSLKRVLGYLSAYNFKLLNVTEISGITYFHAKKIF